MPEERRVKVFTCFSKADKELFRELRVHLSPLGRRVELLNKTALGGDPSGGDAELALIDQAEVVLLLVSPDLLFRYSDSDGGAERFEDEEDDERTERLRRDAALRRCLQRYRDKQIRLIPIIVRPTANLRDTAFGGLVSLPTEKGPVVGWQSRDSAWYAVATGVHRAVEQVAREPAPQPTAGAVERAPREPAPQPTAGAVGMGGGARFTSGYALLIGVGADLPATANDAVDLHDLLIDPARAAYPREQVKLLTERGATRQGILDGLAWLARQVADKPAATVLIFYAGHGVTIRGPGAGFYLIPSDGDRSTTAAVAATCLSGDALSERVRALQSHRVLLIIDSCHAQAIPMGDAAVTPSSVPDDVLERMSQGAGRSILVSCKREQQSYILMDPDGRPARNSLFARWLLESLRGGAADESGQVHLFSLVHRVTTRVEQDHPRQRPLLRSAQDQENFVLCYAGAGPRRAAPSSQPGAGLAQGMGAVEPPLDVSAARRRALRAELEPLLETAKQLREKKAYEDDIMARRKLEYQLRQVEDTIADLEARLLALAPQG